MFLMGQQAAHQLDVNSIHGLFHTLGIPVTSGLGIGLRRICQGTLDDWISMLQRERGLI